MTDLVFDDSEQPSKTIWRALRDSVGDLLRVASAADCAKCGVSKKMMKGRDLYVFESNIWEHDFKIPSPIIEKFRDKENRSTLRCFALVDPVTEDTLADPDNYHPKKLHLHHIEESLGSHKGCRPCGNQIFDPTSMCEQLNDSDQTLRLCCENSTGTIDSSKN